jgi:aspartate/methionine/tyrosine aminotransferase
MTGWRIGWVVLPPDLVRPVERLAGNLFLCAPAVSQVAARAAFDATEELDARRAAYAANREVLLARLAAMGVARTAPADGAFYVYADVSAFTDDSLSWCARALHEADVALIAGGDFDERRGARWVRLAYARDAAEIAAGLDRLDAWIGAGR